MNLVEFNISILDTCVFQPIEEIECPTDSDIQDTVLECNTEGLKHGELCWHDDYDYPLVDGSVGSDEGTYCSDPGEYMFKCVKSTKDLQ